MEKVLETNGRTGRIKVAITGFSALALAIHTFSRSYRFDLTGSVLLLLAALPWLITLLLSEELHIYCNLRGQSARPEPGRSLTELASLKFLLTYFLTEQEFAHLSSLSSNEGDPPGRILGVEGLRMEIRRLRTLGFVEGLPQKGMRTLVEAVAEPGRTKVDLKAHFRITSRGRGYLALRRELLGSSDPFTLPKS